MTTHKPFYNNSLVDNIAHSCKGGKLMLDFTFLPEGINRENLISNSSQNILHATIIAFPHTANYTLVGHVA